MAITSLDILNLSHSLKDVCEVNCHTPECLSQTLKVLLQYNLIQANLQFSQQFDSTAPFPLDHSPHSKPAPMEQGVGLDLTNPNFTHRTDNHSARRLPEEQ